MVKRRSSIRSNLHRQDYHLQALQVQAARYRRSRLVMQQTEEPAYPPDVVAQLFAQRFLRFSDR
jgi:hypothetical protein